MTGWDTKERTKSSTKPTCSFDIYSEHVEFVTMTNFVVLVQFLVADEKNSTQQGQDACPHRLDGRCSLVPHM
jgi:hypothetical protein